MSRRLSVRAVALRYGIPAAAVSRAVNTGELGALMVTTDTGQRRAYIAEDDADRWVSSLRNDASGNDEKIAEALR